WCWWTRAWLNCLLFRYSTLFRSTEWRSVTRVQADSFRALALTHLLASCPSRHLHATGSQPPSCDVCGAKKRSHDRHMTVTASHLDRKSTRLNSSHVKISYAVFCL